MKAIVIDDHRLFVDVIKALLERMGFEVIAIARSAEEARSLSGGAPDLILVDVGLPDQSGLVLGRTLLDTFPDAKVLALTALDDPRAVEEAARSGFHGYLLKDQPVTQFSEAIRSALEGEHVFPRRFVSTSDARALHDDSQLFADQLTPREREVLALLVEGASGQMVARRLGISSNTVRTHVQSILAKLQVHSRLEAVAFAVRHGVVEVPRASRAG
jgi:DNA-binding NarL/FixJ family response regulator